MQLKHFLLKFLWSFNFLFLLISPYSVLLCLIQLFKEEKDGKRHTKAVLSFFKCAIVIQIDISHHIKLL